MHPLTSTHGKDQESGLGTRLSPRVQRARAYLLMVPFLSRSVPLFVLVVLLCSSCAPKNLLTLHRQKDYKEELFWSDSAYILMENFRYNERRVVDDEFCHLVRFDFKRQLVTLLGRTIDVSDTLDVIVRYDFMSVWNWEPEHAAITGTLRFQQADTDRILVQQNVSIRFPSDRKPLSIRGSRWIERREPTSWWPMFDRGSHQWPEY